MMCCSLRKSLLTALFTVLGSVYTTSVLAVSISSNINVSSTQNKAIISVRFNGQLPNYAFFSLHNPERIVLDVKKKGKIDGLPIKFSGHSLVKTIRFSTPKDHQSIRLVFDLSQHTEINVATTQTNSMYMLVFTLVASYNIKASLVHHMTSFNSVLSIKKSQPIKLESNGANHFTKKMQLVTDIAKRIIPHTRHHILSISKTQVIVAIDAGHGGQDPGAIGQNGLKEKNVTIAIARRLKTLLNYNSKFNSVLTRNGDYFISVMGRSDMARKQGANVLVSIHADAAPNSSINGTSVWVLSNRRAHNEMSSWIEQHEKQSELLGGIGDMLVNSQADPYLSQAVLDLQFGHSQKVSYDIAIKVLQNLQNISSLHKSRPEYASLGVLRSPDIPSLLIETGFITNKTGERLLGSRAYQNKIAKAIYKGLLNYFLENPLQNDLKIQHPSLGGTTEIKFSKPDVKPIKLIENLAKNNCCVERKNRSI